MSERVQAFLNIFDTLLSLWSLLLNKAGVLCGKSNEKSSSVVFGSNFAIVMGVHPSRLQIKKKIVPIWSDLALKLGLFHKLFVVMHLRKNFSQISGSGIRTMCFPDFLKFSNLYLIWIIRSQIVY